jgi:hypothetical protein
VATTEADICNVALLRTGSRKFITTFSTDTHTEAVACRYLYPLARKAVLTTFPWQWATKRSLLTVLDDLEYTGWDFAYALPQDCLFARYLHTGLDAEPVEEDRIPYVIEGVSSDAGLVLLPFDQAVIVNEPAVGASVTGDGGATGTLVANLGEGETSGYLLLSDVTGTFVDNEYLNAEYANVDGTVSSLDRVLLTDETDAELVYTEDAETVTRFPPLFEDALAWKIAIDLALGVAVKPQAAMALQAGYQNALSAAAVRDFRQSEPHARPGASYIRARR